MEPTPLGLGALYPNLPKYRDNVRLSSTNGANPTQISPEPDAAPTRSDLLRWRLSYARARIRTSPADATKKKPHLKGWQQKATTNPQQITAEANRWSDAGILTPTGSSDRLMVMDEDIPGSLEGLERELGVALRGITTEVRTPSGMIHAHFSLPEGVEVDGSVGKHVGDGFVGLDVRGKGNMVLLPPTPGYSFANNLPRTEAPPELIEWARGRKRKATPSFVEGARGTVHHEPGDSVPLHSRNAALVSFLSREHDGTKDLGDLIARGVAYRDACFEEPGSFPDADVEKVARNRIAKEPCRPKRKRREPALEVEKALEACSDYWWAQRLPGGGKSKMRDLYRACLMSAARRSEMGEAVTEDGEVLTGPAFSESHRQLGEAANTSHTSAGRNLAKLVDLGALVRIEAPEGMSPTYVLVTPREDAETTTRTRNSVPPHTNLPPTGEAGGWCGGGTPARADALNVPFYGWFSHVSNAKAGVLAALAGLGKMSVEDLAGWLGVSRARDLERRHLRPLEEMGLVQNDGLEWGVVEGYAAVAYALWYEPYATVSRRRARSRTAEGRMVTTVDEHVRVASDAERLEDTKERHRKDRERFADLLKEVAERAEENLRQEEEIRELLNAWDDEREALDRAEADGTIDELERFEEAEHGPAEVPELVQVSGNASDVSKAHDLLQELPQADRPSGLAAALAFWLEKNPGDHPERKPPDEFYAQCSWLASTMDCYELVEGGRPDPMDVARALGELARTVTEEAA